MIDDVLIRAEGISKKYCRNLRKSLWYGVHDICNNIIGRTGDSNNLRPHEFWALEDISFSLRKGESIGLIGRNGAGKTTLLKLINGLIKPTKGKISINGTIGALIALGTGFNPILTGRENIRVAGAVLGLSAKQIADKLDEIIRFAEIGDFIDAPVRSYSSGMLVRLGFSVAIQLNPDILLVDEVLAVGDLSFAVKCHKKITEYKNNGGSMILVSHGMHNVRFHCDRAIWLDKARLQKVGRSSEVCDAYEMFSARMETQSGSTVYVDDSILVEEIVCPQMISSEDAFVFEFLVKSRRIVEKPIIVFSIYDVKSQHLVSNYSNMDGFLQSFGQGANRVRIRYERMPLSNGVYSINFSIHENEVNNHLAMLQNCASFEVQNPRSTFGLMYLSPEWRIESL
jgi:lipopolysaccharide transport system ATP-binding protein